MKKKFILISGIAAAATLSVTSLAVARGQTVFADPVALGDYVATIDQNNKLRVDGSDYFFNLHGGGEYGHFVRKEYVQTLSISVDPNDNYGFSISMAGDDYFGFTMEDLTKDGRPSYYWEVDVDGQKKVVRGFPGANQVTIVYDAPEGHPLSGTPSSNNTRWNFVSSTHVGNRYTDTYTIKETLPAVSRLDFLFTRDDTEEDKDLVLTYNIRSLSIYYTC